MIRAASVLNGLTSFSLLLSAAVGAVSVAPTQAQAGRCYVNCNASAGDGSSWASAYYLLHDALYNPQCTEIWVAAGTYKPSISAPHNLTHSFFLNNGVAIYGGFSGTETQLSQRNPVTNETILSGYYSPSENAYHVVVGSNTDSTAMLDGFTITGGKANGTTLSNQRGGGIYISNGSPTLRNILFSDNFASQHGGGMFNWTDSYRQPTLTNVTFNGNSADNQGGGMYNSGSNPTLTNVTFSDNSAVSDGGGMYNLSSDPTLTNVTFSSNVAYNDGGGMYNRSSTPSLTNVTFSANWAVNGGGMYNNALNDPDNYPQLRNVTFGYNMATNQGSGMYNGGEFIQKSKPICTNVIIAYSYGGRDCFGTLHTGSYYNLIQNEANSCGLADGAQGNIIGQDPLLGPLVNNGGFTLTHALLTDSPAIDTGSPYDYPATDQRDAARPQGARCDIGAYEFEVAPGSFNKTSPLNGTTGQSPGPTLSWGASSGATSYDYCVTTTSGSCGLWQSAGMSTQVTLSGLAGNSTYYWHVRANNGVGTTYSNGLWWSFTTNCMAGILPSLMLLLGE